MEMETVLTARCGGCVAFLTVRYPAALEGWDDVMSPTLDFFRAAGWRVEHAESGRIDTACPKCSKAEGGLNDG